MGTRRIMANCARTAPAAALCDGVVPPHVVERVLNHVSGTFKGVAGVYNRFGYLPEMREALLAWEAHINKLVPLGV